MATLEEKLELVPAGPARKALDKVRWYFSNDAVLATSITQILNEQYPQNPIPLNTVKSSLLSRWQSRIQRRISDLILEAETQLNDFVDGKKEVGGIVNDPNFLRFKRNEGPRICLEIRQMVEPIMDYYQFISRKKLTEFLSLECSTQQYTISYSMINSIFSGHDNKILTPQMVKLYWFMSEMLQGAEQGTPFEVQSRYLIRRRETNKPEPLKNFIGRALEVLLGKETYEDRRFVEESLEKLRRVKQVTDLKRALKVSYGFSSNDAIDEFFA